MTINKSQGQTLNRTILYLFKPVFAYGQLYVALSQEKTLVSRILLFRILLKWDGGSNGLPPMSRQTAAPEGWTRSEAEKLNPRKCKGKEGS
ncbi:hypothetical protein BDC45DRAFT_56017 [Circinella umbellata]|nr:hypothetical protein BDC45DRAFT_56017 [Circinella umbellata]